MKALGIHVFAGGFTQGVMEAADVTAQFETHNFGRESVEDLGVPFINEDSWEGWLAHRDYYEGVNFVFGNPRCTGFSCITSGYDESSHGPWSEQTQDVHDLCNFSVKAGVDVIIWESVQQAFSVGRPLLDHLRDTLFVPNGYRIAHVFINAASYGNCQIRRRYFFVAYRGDHNFNIEPPTLPQYQATVRDIIAPMQHRKTRPCSFGRDANYDRDSYLQLNEREWSVVPHLPQRCCLNRFAKLHEDKLAEICPKYYDTWMTRESSRPFSLHCITRIAWNRQCPTLHSSCSRLIHPALDRPLTVGELATIMGWKGRIPRGLKPVAQIVKGVVPDIGRWLAVQVMLYLKDAWGTEDFATKYNHHSGVWEGEWLHDRPVEKVMDMTHYSPPFREGDGK